MSVTTTENRTAEEQELLDTIWQYWEVFSRGDMRFKFEVMDMDEEMHVLAVEYLRRYDGDFEFLTDIKAKGVTPNLTQAKGILNTAIAGIKREKGLIGKRRQVEVVPADGYYCTLKEEMYFRVADWAKADPGTKVLSILTEVKPKMKWQGVAAVRPDKSYSIWRDHRDTEIEQRVEELLQGMADWDAMQWSFAKALNRCSTCGKALTSPIDENHGKCPKCGKAAAPTSPEPPSPSGVQGVKLEGTKVPF